MLKVPKTFYSKEEGRAIIRNNTHLLKPVIEQNITTFKSYLETVLPASKKLLMVDISANRFSSQKLLQLVFNRTVQFAYWAVWGNEYPRFSYFSLQGENGRTGNVDFLLKEFFLTSPEPPIESLENGKPVYKRNYPSEEANRI